MGGADFFSAEVATSTLTFSRDCPSFPRRTIQYESYFPQGSGFDSSPGSTHVAAQARAALAAWREGSWELLRAALEEQCAFDRDYLAGWLPDYAAGLCRMKTAHLYPQLAKGLAAFARLDRDFCANAMAWLASGEGLPEGAPRASRLCEELQAYEGRLRAIRLKGLEENELRPVK